MARADFGAVFGRVVRAHRERRGLSQEALADAAGLNRNYVGMIERGERTPTVTVALELARALGTSLASLAGEAERAWQRRQARRD